MNERAFALTKGALPQKRQDPLKTMTDEELLAHLRVTPTKELPPMTSLFTMFGTPTLYRGELTAVCGKAKSGKTMFLSVIMAACFREKVMALERHTEHEPHTDATDPTDNGAKGLRVLWIDTEQSEQSTQDIMRNRILPIARGEGTESADDSTDYDECLFAYNLRGLGFEKRMELTKAAIAQVKPDLVILDGIKDLMTDINDAVQATLITEQLMALVQKFNCCMVCVLHQNKSDADHNMRGSIGTELTNKAFEVYTCEFLEERSVFKVTQSLSRRERIKQRLDYRLDDDHLPVACDLVQEQPRDNLGRWTSKKDNTDLCKLFTEAFEGRTARPYKQLMGAGLRIGNTSEKEKYYAWYKAAIEQEIIREMKHPETEETWVELVENELPF